MVLTPGPSPKITYTGANGNDYLQAGPNDTLSYILWGAPNPYLLILKDETVGTTSKLTVWLIDFTAPTIKRQQILSVLSDTAHPPPQVVTSKTTGDAFAIWVPTATGLQAIQLCRSDTGAVLCSYLGPYISQAGLGGNATATLVEIEDGQHVIAQQAIPKASLNVQGGPLTFPNVAIGGCPQPPPQKTFTLRNSGTDCLTVTSVGSVPPYTFIGANPPLRRRV